MGQTPTEVRALIDGNVLDQTSNGPLKTARVKLQKGTDEPIYTKADAQGHFSFPNLEPGTYALTVQVPDYQPARSSINVAIPKPARAGGAIGAARPANVAQAMQISKTTEEDGTIHATATVPMVANVTIVGKITDPTGAPMPGASVEIQAPRPQRAAARAAGGRALPDVNTPLMVTANSLGEFRAGGLPPGTYWVVANKPNAGPISTWDSSYRATYFPGTLTRDSAKQIALSAGQQTRADIQILNRTGVTVKGHIYGLPAQPADGSIRTMMTRLSLTPAQADVMNANPPSISAQTDYQFTDILPGKYTLFVETDARDADPMAMNQKPVYGLVKEDEIGQQDMNGLDVTLEPLKGLSGTAEFGEGCGNRTTTVRLAPQGSGGMGFFRRQLQAEIGPDGAFTLPAVPAGRFSIMLQGAGGTVSGPMRISSATKGERDLLVDGLESPWTDDAGVKLKIACQAVGVRK
jgi:protocatechuate 3,4-dioxygenase beta subunit